MTNKRFNNMKYLSEIINELPKNCLYSKARVGAGGTSLCLENDEPYVIAVPYVSLVDNKVSQYPNKRRKEPIFGVKEGITIYDIRSYLKDCKKNSIVPKIMVTYDSLFKVTQSIKEDVKGFNLLIDEYHLLFLAYSYRSEAIKRVLEEYKLYKSFTFMTATPLQEEFILEELRGLPFVSQEWPDKDVVIKINAIRCPNFKESVLNVINSFLSGLTEGNAYFFVNSVDMIKKLIKAAHLTEDNCRVVYSKNNKTKLSIHNGSVNDTPKKLNFITSCCFEGCDIYDEDGKIFILSESSKPNTLLDISTTVTQIANRVRNSKYREEITHLYNTSIFPDCSYEEYKQIVEKNIEEEKRAVSDYNSLSESSRKLLKVEDCGYKYMGEDNKLIYDANRSRIDLYNFKVCKGEYSIRLGIINEYEKAGYEVNNLIHITEKQAFEKEDNAKMTFKEVVEYLKDNQNSICYRFLIDEACLQYPFIKEAIDVLGYERISSLKYVQKDIKNELLKLSNTTLSNKMIILIKKVFKNGFFYSSSRIKEEIQKAYNILGIKDKAKATDITKWFNAERKTKRIDGISTDGFLIINNK